MGRRLEGDAGCVAELFDLGDLGLAVDMAAHHVAAEFVADPERAFEVEPRTGLPEARAGDAQGLRRQLDVEHRAAAGPRLAPDHRQADAGAGDRGADRYRLGVVGAVDGETPHMLALGHRGNPADVGDDPGEHDQATRR